MRKLDIFFKWHGMASCIWLFPMSNTSRFVQLARDFGITPSSRFSLRFRVCKLQYFENLSNIVPMRLFLLRLRTPRVLLSVEKHWGSVPLKELWDKSRTWRDLALHIDSGICPWNLLLARDKKVAEIMELPMLAGITELKLFLDKSKCITDGKGVDSCPWSWVGGKV